MTSLYLPAVLFPLPLCLLLGAAYSAAAGGDSRKAFSYPQAPTSDTVDDYHGQKIADPYRPLEDPDAPATRAWIEAENRLTESWLASVPERPKLRERLTKLWNYERTSPPSREGGLYFFTKNDGLQDQAVLYVLPKLDAVPRVLLDPNTLSPDGTVALSGYAVSKDGKHLAYGLAAAGSDWNEWRVLDVASGEETGDLLKWVKFSGAAWTADGKGFYYSRFDAPVPGRELEALNRNQKLFYHRLGTPQAEDLLVYERPDDPELGFGPTVSDDGRYLVVGVWKGTDTRNRIYVRDLTRGGGGFVKLFDDFDAKYEVVDNVGTLFYVWTDKDAPRGRVATVDLSAFERALAADPKAKPVLRDVIPPSADVVTGVRLIADRLVVQTMRDAAEEARIFTLAGKLEKKIALPTLGLLGGFTGKRTDTETFYTFTSFTYPTTVFRYDFAAGASTIFRKPKVDFDPAAFETKRLFYSSRDGTRIPMFLVHRKGMKTNGRNPTYLYGYGGFNVAEGPSFSPGRIAWLESGGLYAQPSIRGGSEYGEEWHKGGMLGKKQNVFDDFIAAAEWLVANKWTSPPYLGIVGGSNGGLLVGAVLNQRPDLFGAAVPAVGVMDMLRFHKFTIGWAWVSDYGSPDDPEAFKWIHPYSPLHNIRKGAKYPAVLAVTADHDDRVVPAHSFKYTAALQAAQGGDAPILVRIETKAGHGAGKPTAKLIEETADIQAFLLMALGASGGAAT
ncbi:MAG TPA: prolyl oligopeptidase family serine peptidase [Thermoanaerobaculia bacterium]|nr:prolyl oligopeptidase family serine peptidase [Thermoanaerobaculia bacterium]